jgi:hypothetical protein
VFPKHVYVQEVVREPRMHFFKVPKLGSYLAIRLEYDSCLFEQALNVAVSDYLDVKSRQKEQDEEKRQYYEKLEDDKNDEENTDQREDKQWEDIKPQPYLTQKVSFVVCLNTMGQDREFTDDEKKFALRTIRAYRDRWEEVEKSNLEQDVIKTIKRLQFDKEYKEQYD